MSTPGGYGGYGQDPNQQYDPMTGQPVPNPGQTAAYPTGPDTGGYQGLGQYPQTSAFPNNFPTGGFQQPTPPPKKRTGLIVGIIAAVVVIAAGATLTVVLLNKNGDDQAGGGGNPTTTTSAPPRTTTTTSTPTTTTSPGGGGPLVPGWQTVTVANEHVQYDVPPDWKIETGSNAAISIPNSTATMEGIATYKTGACPGHDGSFRAKVGVGPESSGDPAATAEQIAKTWADGLAANYGGKSAAPKATPQKVNNGKTEATLAVARITTTKDTCNPPAMLVAVVSFKSGSSTESVILFGDQDVSGAITSNIAAQVLVTARPSA